MSASSEKAADRPHWALTTPAAVAVFALAVWLRSRGLDQDLLFLGDQVRDWRIALSPLGSLPWHGTPSGAGGFTLGPVFYWVLWADAHIVGLFGPPLPHVGVAVFSVLTAAADALLMVAVARRFGNLWLAGAISIVLVTSPFDLTLDRTIWNPNLAVALVKVFLALMLVEPGPAARLRHWAVAVLTGWLAMQAHSAATWVVAPALAFAVIRALGDGGLRLAGRFAGIAAAIVLVLQLPMLTHLSAGAGLLPGRLLSGEAGLGLVDRWREALLAMLAAVRRILFEFGPLWASNAALGVSATIVLWRHRRDGMLLVLLLGPFIACLPAMAMWQGTHEQYWFRTLVPSAALLIGAAIVAVSEWMPAGPRIVGPLVLVAALAAAPARIGGLDRYERTTAYGTMLRASRTLAASQAPVAGIQAAWLHHSADENILFELLGGRFARDGQIAVIGQDGEITWKAPRR